MIYAAKFFRAIVPASDASVARGIDTVMSGMKEFASDVFGCL